MTKPRVIIIAAGDATRWGNYLGVPKHLIEINGETLLERQVRLATERGAEVIIVTRDARNKQYQVPGAKIHTATLRPSMRDADKFASSVSIWSPNRRTIILYGDCYFTSAAMDQILDPREYVDGWHAFARFGASSYTGTPYGENLAHAIDPGEGRYRYLNSLYDLPVLCRPEWFGGRCGGWEQYMNLTTGNPMQPPVLTEHATHIDDWSDDFDFPADYDRWTAAFAAASPEIRALAN